MPTQFFSNKLIRNSTNTNKMGKAKLKLPSRVDPVWKEKAKGPKTNILRAWSPLIFNLGLGKLNPNLAAPEARIDLAQTPTATVDNHFRQ